MWWAGGDDAGTAAEVRDPWRVIREVDLSAGAPDGPGASER
jgi:hypothetical protein